MMRLILCVLVCLSSAYSVSCALIEDEDSSSTFAANIFRPSQFTKSFYKASVIDGQIVFTDGPIIIDNALDDMYFVISSGNYPDYTLSVESKSPDQKQIQLGLTQTDTIDRDFDVINLEALDEDLAPISRTTILLFNSNVQSDIYRMIFKVDGHEYIILDFFYFKWFLGLLIVTGFLILFIELHEVVKHVHITRKTGKYQELENV